MLTQFSDTDTDSNTSASSHGTDSLITDSLKKLQSANERRLLDVVDKLRRTGLNGIIELPQLVVCGDQSSGKSSVLEAITEIPFPRKAGLCTRFATEIVLRRRSTSSVTVKINPSKLRTSAEQTKLSLFSKTITDLSELPDVIEKATAQMGLGQVGESAAFSRDILSVEISGPDRPQLTLVDLPGLIHSATKANTEADKDLIFMLVTEYMKNPRTIILAVVSAKNDIANQIVLSLFAKHDPKGSRTLGIITKPDCIMADDESSWFALAENKEIFLERGWHMIENRSETETNLSFDARNIAEHASFSTGKFSRMPRESVGVEGLRSRLSKLLLQHLIKELPSLKEEMVTKLERTKHDLEALGEKRETPTEQRMMLMKTSMGVHQILTAAVNGNYLHPFFVFVDSEGPVDGSTKIARFRAVIQHLNFEFAETMRKRGHKFEFIMDASSNNTQSSKALKDDSGDGFSYPDHLSRDQAIQWARAMILRCRGLELPGSVNPEVISHLFREQSQPWAEFATDHIDTVASMCRKFINQVISYAVPKELQTQLSYINVNTTLRDAVAAGKEELRKLLQDKARHPSTYNHYYSDLLQNRRLVKYQILADRAQEVSTKYIPRENGTQKANLDAAKFKANMAKAVERDMTTFSAEEALESQKAYYKDELKYFVHAVTKQVIERCMIDPLPSKILSPMVVASMTDEQVAYLAAESSETVNQRAFLEERRKMLDEGFEIFREAQGGVKRGRGGS